MTSPSEKRNAAYGVLIGWTSTDLGSKIILNLQSTNAEQGRSSGEFDEYRYFLTKNQAAVFANYLFEVSGHAPRRRHKRSWLDRMMAG